MFIIPEYALKCLETLENNGFEAYIVGGSVRDFLMNKIPHDFDITTNAKPCQIKKCFKENKIIDIGEKHGTIAVIISGETVEITTYRIDGEYNDSRHPEKVVFSENLKEDLKRRDFTINSMAMNRKGEIVDLYGGREDLQTKTIRTVGNAAERFREDALRIMRALRFASQIEFEIESETSKRIHEFAYLLKNISIERIRDEFLKLICGRSGVKIIREYSDVIEIFIPEIASMYGFLQHTPYHKFDVWEHTLHAVDNAPENSILKITMLLHDIAKPDCMTIDENGQGHFKGHASLGAIKAEKILKRLKFSASDTKEIVKLIENHRNSYKCDADVKCMMNKIGAESFERLLSVKFADDNAKGYYDGNDNGRIAFAKKRMEEIIHKKECYRISDMKISGNDLIKIGFEGKEIGKVLNLLLEEIIKENLENSKKALICYAKNIKTNGK